MYRKPTMYPTPLFRVLFVGLFLNFATIQNIQTINIFNLTQELVSTGYAVYISCVLILILSLKKKVVDSRNVGFLPINRFLMFFPLWILSSHMLASFQIINMQLVWNRDWYFLSFLRWYQWLLGSRFRGRVPCLCRWNHQINK